MQSIAQRCWVEIPNHFPNVELDEWVVMPNHVHGIVVISYNSSDYARRGVQLNAPTKTNRDTDDPFSTMSPHRNTLAVVVRTYKAAVTTRCRRAGNIDFGWQRNYYEHVVRDEGELDRIRQYILDNPIQWETDEYNPNRQTKAGVCGKEAI